jgi:ribosomal protein L11 methyltransferase
MLKALQSIALRDRTVLDIGCGSGVLAIAAVCLGARCAVGVDIDPDALSSAAENLQLNGVDDRVRLEQQDFRLMSTPFQVVMANLSGGLLERSVAALAQLVATDGDLIVSGFMQTDTNVVPCLEKFLLLKAVDQEEEWMCAILRRVLS